MTTNSDITETVTLGTIANVQIGATRHSKLLRRDESISGYENFVSNSALKIQLVSMSNFRTLSSGHLNPVPSSNPPALVDGRDLEISERVALLKSGDIILNSRGTTMDATLVPTDIGRAVLISPLFRIRVKDNASFIAGYLQWYMNQPFAQHFFKKHSEGSALKMVSRRNLLELPIPIIPLESQEKIVRLSGLQIKEEELTLRILQNRAKQIEQFFAELISSNTQKQPSK